MQKLYLLVLLFFITACSYAPEWKEVKVNNQFSLSFPSYMEEYTERKLNPKAALQYLNFFRNIYSLVIVENKAESKMTLQEYVIKSKQELVDLMKQPQQVDSIQVNINGLSGIELTLTGVVAGAKDTDTRIFYKLVFLESKTHLYQLVLWTWEDRREKYLVDMQKIIHSFKEL